MHREGGGKGSVLETDHQRLQQEEVWAPRVQRKVGGKAELCGEHAKESMIGVYSKRCSQSSSTSQPLRGKVGGKSELCAEHA